MTKLRPMFFKNVTEDNLFLDSFKKPCHFHMTESI